MPVCAKAIQQPDGSLVLALDPARQDLSTCPYVVDDGASNAWRELGNMSIENASVIGVAVGGVWGVAWAFKALIKAASINDSERE
jgi:hypothetical protein